MEINVHVYNTIVKESPQNNKKHGDLTHAKNTLTYQFQGDDDMLDLRWSHKQGPSRCWHRRRWKKQKN